VTSRRFDPRCGPAGSNATPPRTGFAIVGSGNWTRHQARFLLKLTSDIDQPLACIPATAVLWRGNGGRATHLPRSSPTSPRHWSQPNVPGRGGQGNPSSGFFVRQARGAICPDQRRGQPLGNRRGTSPTGVQVPRSLPYTSGARIIQRRDLPCVRASTSACGGGASAPLRARLSTAHTEPCQSSKPDTAIWSAKDLRRYFQGWQISPLFHCGPATHGRGAGGFRFLSGTRTSGQKQQGPKPDHADQPTGRKKQSDTVRPRRHGTECLEHDPDQKLEPQ